MKIAMLVPCDVCGEFDQRQNMVYQGEHGPEHTAPGSAFDYYVCIACEAWQKRVDESEDYEGDDAVFCVKCGVLYQENTRYCTVCQGNYGFTEAKKDGKTFKP